jgi:hypothetical protein
VDPIGVGDASPQQIFAMLICADHNGCSFAAGPAVGPVAVKAP